MHEIDQEALSEIKNSNFLRTFQHNNFVRHFEFFETENAFVTEFCNVSRIFLKILNKIYKINIKIEQEIDWFFKKNRIFKRQKFWVVPRKSRANQKSINQMDCRNKHYLHRISKTR